MRSFVLLPAALLTGCLIQNPGFDPGEATTLATTTSGELTGLTDTTGSPDITTTGDESSTDASTTGCARVPLFPDVDNDGYGAGEMVLACPGDPGFAEVDGDCDDNNAGVLPGALEICNTLDDDCDALTDEFSPANSACGDCELAEFGGHSYWFCTRMLSWDDARSLCQSFGAVELPIVDDAQENDFIYSDHSIDDSPMWIGGRDLDPDKPLNYTWYDGSPLTFNNFSTSDLDDGCIAMVDGDKGKWRDRDCNFTYSVACESTK